MQAELPAAWRSFVSYKSGNIIAFLDSLMNSVLSVSYTHLIFTRALDMLNIYEDSKTYIVDAELEDVVAKMRCLLYTSRCV